MFINQVILKQMRYKKDDVVVIERNYPRRQHYAIVANLGKKKIEMNLSHMYYGGNIIASSYGLNGYFKFRHTSLEPGDAFVCVLDK